MGTGLCSVLITDANKISMLPMTLYMAPSFLGIVVVGFLHH